MKVIIMSDVEETILTAAAAIIIIIIYKIMIIIVINAAVASQRYRRPRRFGVRPSIQRGRKKYSARRFFDNK